MNETDNEYDCMPGWYTLIVAHKKGGWGRGHAGGSLSESFLLLKKKVSCKIWLLIECIIIRVLECM